MLTASGGPFRGRRRAELADVTVDRGAGPPDVGHGPDGHAQLGHAGQQGPRADRGPPAVRRPLRPHRRRRAPAVDRPLDGHLHRRRHDRPGQPAGHAAADRARAGLAASGCRARRRRAAGTTAQSWTFEPLDDDAFPGVRLARAAGALGGCVPAVLNAANEEAVGGVPRGRAARSPGSPTRSRACSTPPTRGRPIRLPWRTCWPPRTGPAPAPASSPVTDRPRSRPMMIVLGIVLFFLGLLFSIAWHELGHFTTARWFGIKVPEFMVGFGRTVWSRQGRRDRVRAQGHPARRLHPHDRHDPARQGRARSGRDRRTGPFQGLIDDARAAVGDGRAARRRGPPVLDARALEADRRDVRRAVHEPHPGGGALRDRADGDRRARERHHHRHGQRVRRARLAPTVRHLPARARRRRPPPRRASSRATGSSRSTASRSTPTTATACAPRSRAPTAP